MYPSAFRCKSICTAGYPYYPSGRPHGGEDYVPENKSIESNWSLYSPIAGTVYKSRKYGDYGNYLVIMGDDGYGVLMAHMKSLPVVKVGQRVEEGTYVGVAGATGNVTGRHLHIEVADLRNVKYNQSTWYEVWKKHRVKPSNYIDFTNYDPEGGDFDVKDWHNGSTTEYVFQTVSDCKRQENKIGSLAPYESAECYGIIDDVYLVAYTVNGTTNKKCGFVKYRGGVR